jgi:hypothetical protein
VLFRADSEIGSGPGVEFQVGYWISRRLVAEAAFTYGEPQLRTSISGDFEQAPTAVASDTLSQYTVEGGVRVHLLGSNRRDRGLSPFVSASGGYLRQLSSDAFAIETGAVVRVGGGVTWTIGSRPHGFARAWGARADARMNWRTGGVDIEDKTRAWPSAGGGLFVRF